jgi:hypothetical protein
MMPNGVTARARDAGFAPERLARLDGWMQAQVDGGRLAGLNALVMRRGEIAYRAAYGMANVETAYLLDDQGADLGRDHDAV